jgi:CHASE3 domain sensor protein
MDDDAALAREVREAREVERHVVDALRQDGTFDALRKRLVEDASSKDELRSVVANALANSAALQKIDPARKMTEKETVDALREELEDTVMTAFSKELWDLMTDEQEGLGRELYEAVYAARERLKAP